MVTFEQDQKMGARVDAVEKVTGPPGRTVLLPAQRPWRGQQGGQREKVGQKLRQRKEGQTVPGPQGCREDSGFYSK